MFSIIIQGETKVAQSLIYLKFQDPKLIAIRTFSITKNHNTELFSFNQNQACLSLLTSQLHVEGRKLDKKTTNHKKLL